MFNIINLRRLAFVGILSLTLTSLSAQSLKPAFKKLVIADYKVDTVKGRQVITVSRLLEIGETGQLHIRVVRDRAQMVLDTTYQISDEQLAKLNRILGRGLPMKTYMIAGKLPQGAMFGGTPVYIACSHDNGERETFIWIYPFMDSNFNAAFGFRLNWPRNKMAFDKNTHNTSLEADILKMHNACTYLPPMGNPPTVRELKVADPQAKQ